MISKAGVAWILGGVAVGAALGVLLAPQSGKMTRASIKHNLLRLREKYRASHLDRQESVSR